MARSSKAGVLSATIGSQVQPTTTKPEVKGKKQPEVKGEQRKEYSSESIRKHRRTLTTDMESLGKVLRSHQELVKVSLESSTSEEETVRLTREVSRFEKLCTAIESAVSQVKEGQHTKAVNTIYGVVDGTESGFFRVMKSWPTIREVTVTSPFKGELTALRIISWFTSVHSRAEQEIQAALAIEQAALEQF